MKPTLAIVSSYNESCGNASYTGALAASLGLHYDVSIIPLNLKLLRDPAYNKEASIHIHEMAEKLKQFDAVNIQYEEQLFGVLPNLIYERIEKLINANAKMVITFHRYDKIQPCFSLKQFIKASLRFRLIKYLKQSIYIYYVNQHAYLTQRIIKLGISKNIPFLLHTPRDRELLIKQYDYNRVFDHPLSFYRQEKIQETIKSLSREEFLKKYQFSPKNVYVGIFGFLNEYKGHETAILAMQYLPESYHLLIFGAQHPQTIQYEEKISPYIDSLVKMITREKLNHRVHFCGNLGDEDFLKALVCCDYNVLPYLEVNQGGSGIASISLETNSRAIFSQNNAFLELAKYAPDCFKMISIGNYLELANAILRYQDIYQENRKKFYATYNPNTAASLYYHMFSLEKSDPCINTTNFTREP